MNVPNGISSPNMFSNRPMPVALVSDPVIVAIPPVLQLHAQHKRRAALKPLCSSGMLPKNCLITGSMHKRAAELFTHMDMNHNAIININSSFATFSPAKRMICTAKRR